MLTVKNRNAAQAIDYYTQGICQTNQTRWFGRGAATLGLSGRVNNHKSFANVCNGLTPDGNSKLGRNSKWAAIDCTFSAPKSVSLSALLGEDERLVKAHRLAVEQTLLQIEKYHAQTRLRLGNTRYRVNTGNLIVAQFDHIESRELDPHLHTHALVMNLTQADNGRWYSLHNREIYKHKKHLGMLYQSHLRAEVETLGYGTVSREHGQFEIAGYAPEVLVNFSKRRRQILAEVGGVGASWQTREDAWSITRKNKQFLPLEELKQAWKREAARLGIVPVVPKNTLSLYKAAELTCTEKHQSDQQFNKDIGKEVVPNLQSRKRISL